MEVGFFQFFSYFFLIFLINLGLFTTVSVDAFALPPRLSVNGYVSEYTGGEADLMLPMAGDEQHNFYLDPRLAYATNNQGYGDLGLGYRGIKNDAAILGLYLFGGYTRIDNNARLWVANPGIEALGSRWDAHLNAYFPIKNRHQTLGDVQNFYFTGHSEFAYVLHLSQYAGNGADISLGGQLFPHTSLKAYLGSYFFNPAPTNNIWGGAAGLEYWLASNVKVFANYTYDNLHHSTGAFGLGVEFGGVHTARINPTLEERITDPVERYLAELGRGPTIPSRMRVQQTPGSLQLLADNIAFFSQVSGANKPGVYFSQAGGPNNGGVGLIAASCTFENPCGPTDLTNQGVSTLNALFPNTQMYFNGGTYNALDVVGGTKALTLLPGQGIFSRTADYSQPATGAARSIFVGQFVLPGSNTISNAIILAPPGNFSTAIQLLPNEGNVLITGSQIGSSTDTNAQPNIGIGSAGAGPFNDAAIVDNVTVFARNLGINFGGPSLTVRNSVINAGSSPIATSVIGIRPTEANSIINLQNTQINVSSNIASSVIGLQNSFSGTQITASDITISVNASAVGAEVDAFSPGNSTTSITVNRGTITSNSPAGSAYIVGGAASSTGLVNINQATLAVNGSTALIKKAISGVNLTITSSACRVNGSTVIC